MKRLSSAKRNQLIMVLLVTAALIGTAYFLLISPQNNENRQLISQTNDRQTDLDKYKKLISETETTSNQLASVSSQLDNAERDMASGDVYAWVYDTIRRFKANYHLDIPTIGQPTVGDVDMLPHFPYKQVQFTLNGTAYYHDLGKFVADFENNFPHVRLVNLAIQPSSDPNSNPEMLSFHVEVIALIKPNS
jgi:Tfp pilus assembly protein PilO